MPNMSSKESHIVLGTAAAGILGATYLLAKRRTKAQPLHVTYQPPNFPFAFKVLSLLPQSVRRSMAIKGAAPKPPRDAVDVWGDCDDDDGRRRAEGLYETTELLPNKLWRVRYKHLNDPKLGEAMKNVLGVDLMDPSVPDRAPTHLRDLLVKDQECAKRAAELSEKEQIDGERLSSFNMLVVRLEGVGDEQEGGLLLFNPVRMRRPVLEWLTKIGGERGVEWIVSGSSAHTNQVPQAVEAFPSAKILLAGPANDKCVAVGMKPADFAYTDPGGLTAAGDELAKRGVRIHYVDGDCVAHALVVLAHGYLLEVDLLYSDGIRPMGSDKEDWEKPCCDGERHRCGGRLFFYGGIKNSPNGCIPAYRFFGMDPACVFTSLMVEAPRPDGSSCKDMAASLRQMLKMDFDQVEMVHSERKGSIPGDEFRTAIDQSWSWLNAGGESLLA